MQKMQKPHKYHCVRAEANGGEMSKGNGEVKKTGKGERGWRPKTWQYTKYCEFKPVISLVASSQRCYIHIHNNVELRMRELLAKHLYGPRARVWHCERPLVYRRSLFFRVLPSTWTGCLWLVCACVLVRLVARSFETFPHDVVCFSTAQSFPIYNIHELAHIMSFSWGHNGAPIYGCTFPGPHTHSNFSVCRRETEFVHCWTDQITRKP